MKKSIEQDFIIQSKNNAKKKKQDIPQPHDAFFKENMGKKEVITDFLESYLPEEIASKIDGESILAIEPKTVSPKLKLGEADLGAVL